MPSSAYRPVEEPDPEVVRALVTMEARVAQHHGDEARLARLAVRAAIGLEFSDADEAYRLVLDGVPLDPVPVYQVNNAILRLRRQPGE
jgi:hypothetical protein